MTMSGESQKTLIETITELRVLLTRLERLSARDGRALDKQITDALHTVGPLTTTGITKMLRRRRNDVVATLALLEQTGRVSRDKVSRLWRLDDDAEA